MSASPLPERIGRYEVVRLVGEGAMGRVLLGHDPVLDRDVAIKLLRDDLKLDLEQRQALFHRMRHEARASARVSHPNIVVLHDMGEDSELGLYLVSEYAEGTTLKQRLAIRPLGPEKAAELARQIGDALATAHRAGVLHRDIKPENIIMTPSGGKIADFGIARIPESTLTRDGGLLGTPAYSSPESIKDGTFSPHSDQFSMAATLYEAISGRRAYPGDDAIAVANKITHERAPPVARSVGLDPHVDAVLLRALSKHPPHRFPSCADFGAALAEALTLTSRTVMQTEPDALHKKQLERAQRNQKWRLIAAGALGGALFTASSFQLFGPKSEPLEEPRLAGDLEPTPAVGWLSESAPVPGYAARARTTPPKKERPQHKASSRGATPAAAASVVTPNEEQPDGG